MVAYTSLIGTAALLVRSASALPRPWAASSAAAMPYAASAAVASSADSWDTMAAAPTMASMGMGSDSMGSGSMGSDSMGSGSMGSDSKNSWDASSMADTWGASSAYDSMATAASSWSDSMSSDVMVTATAMATSDDSWWSSTETAMASEVSSDAMWSATATAAATSTYETSYAAMSTAAATSSIMYGSGSSNWGGSGYESCVQQCMMDFGAPAATVTASATSSSSYSGSDSSSGSGTTHTVIVAPTQGVLRFVPFTVNASAGDTILYMWNANNHTVTKSSELEICNETSQAPFATGEHDKGFTFTEVVNDTSPVFFYCSTPTHCEKGMFGIINPPSVENNANTSVASMMPAMMSNSSTLSAMYAASNISSNPMAASWGENMDMGSMPTWSQSFFAENVLYTRAFLAANPSVMKPDGTIDMSAANGTWTVPADVTQALSSSTNSTGASSASTSATSSAASGAPSSTGAAKSGARSTAVSGGVFSVVAIAAVFLAL